MNYPQNRLSLRKNNNKNAQTYFNITRYRRL